MKENSLFLWRCGDYSLPLQPKRKKKPNEKICYVHACRLCRYVRARSDDIA